MSIQKGFSLLEALVTLVIVAMVVTLLTQSLLQVLALRARVVDIDRRSWVSALHEAWFRDSATGLVADFPSKSGAFTGDANGWSGWTTRAPSAGGQRVVTWRLKETDEGRVLTYQSDADPPQRIAQADPLARFHYVDRTGVFHDGWPVPTLPAELLPSAIVFADPASAPPLYWYVDVAAAPGLPQSVRFSELPHAPGI